MCIRDRSGIDTKIEPLVKFLNQLDGVITIGSCQGHDDGAGSGEWVYPYIKFKCTNNMTLGFLASLEDAYKSINEQAELKYYNFPNVAEALFLGFLITILAYNLELLEIQMLLLVPAAILLGEVFSEFIKLGFTKRWSVFNSILVVFILSLIHI